MIINVRFPPAVDGRLPDLAFQISNSTAVSIALPTIGSQFNADPLLLQWIVSAYSLSSVSQRPRL